MLVYLEDWAKTRQRKRKRPGQIVIRNNLANNTLGAFLTGRLTGMVELKAPEVSRVVRLNLLSSKHLR